MSETREVYVGGSRTINVKDGEGKYLDIAKLDELLKSTPNVDISVDMRNDWYFTGRTVKRDEKLIEQHFVVFSSWDTPVARYEFNDKEIEVDLTATEEKNKRTAAFFHGYSQASIFGKRVMELEKKIKMLKESK